MSSHANRVLVAVLTLALVGAAVPAGATPTGQRAGTACASASAWTPTDIGTDGGDDVQVIVVYENSAARRDCGGSAVAAVGGTVTERRPSDLVPMSVATVDPAAIPALERRPEIASVERDAIGQAVGFDPDERAGGSGAAETVPWGIDRVNGTEAAALVSDADMGSIDVAVIDSGIDLQHADLDGNLVWGADLINGANRTGLQYTDDVLDHGTHVAGTIAAEDDGQGIVGMAPNVSLYSIRVLNSSNFGYYSWWIKGIDHAVRGPDGRLGTEDDAEILSMSLGGSSHRDALERAITEASHYAVIVAAAGNNGNGVNRVLYPAAYPETIAVAATDKSDQTTGFSSEGPAVDIAAPGERILSTVPPEFVNGYEYAYLSGTSMATPHVSGAAALVLAQDVADGERDLTNADVRDRLTSTALDIHADGVDVRSGYGRLRALRAMQSQSSDDPPTAAFDVIPESPYVNETVTFDAGNATDDRGIASYNWTIAGERVTETDPAVTGTFTEAGTFTASLTVVDTAGQTNTTNRTVTVRTDEPPVAAFDVRPSSPYTNETVTFDAGNATDDRGIASYNWTIAGERVTETGSNVIRTFASPGTYNVSLTVYDTAGQANSTNRTVTVRADDPPVPVIDVRPEPSYVNRTVTFDAANTTDDRGIASYNWTVAGERLTETGPNVTRTFASPGTYNASLTVVDTAGQANSTNRTVTVRPGLTVDALTVRSPIRVNESAVVQTTVSVGDVAPGGDVPASLQATVTVDGTAVNATTQTVRDGDRVGVALAIDPGATGNYTVAVTATASVDGTTYAATSPTARLDVRDRNASVPPTLPVVGEAAPGNLDGDPLLEDVDGNGKGNVMDALAYFNNRRSDVIEDHPEYFDFNGDGWAGSIGDAIALFDELTA